MFYIYLFVFSISCSYSIPVNILEQASVDDDIEDRLFRSIKSILEDHTSNGEHENISFVSYKNNFQRYENEKAFGEGKDKESFGNMTHRAAFGINQAANKSLEVQKSSHLVKKRDEPEVVCVNDIDCNSTFYCDKSSYSCRSCGEEKLHCSTNDQCCNGYECDKTDKMCKRKKGKQGDPCEELGDCNIDHCCALNNYGDGVCQPYIREGQDCAKDPFDFDTKNSHLQELMSGLPNRCLCLPGLTCEKQNSFLLFESEVCVRKRNNIGKNNPAQALISDSKPAYNLKENADGEPDTPFKYHDETLIKEPASLFFGKEAHVSLFPLNMISFLESIFSEDEGDEQKNIYSDENRRTHSVQQNEQKLSGDVKEEDALIPTDGMFDSILKGVLEAIKYRER